MRIKAIISVFILFFSVFISYADETKGLTVVAKTLGKDIQVGKQYLILIAIEKYEYWNPLKNPVKDAMEIKEILTSKYYIDEVIELYNGKATKANIIKTLNDMRRRLKPEDSLIIFYSGHGTYDKKTNTGFWIPVNAKLDPYEQINWLPNPQIHGLVANLKALHVLIISDSCFAGDIISSSRSEEMPDVSSIPYIKNAYIRASRQVITSGDYETVPDSSEFSRQLKFALEKNKQPFLDALSLFNEIKLGVRESFPLIGFMKGTVHQEGGSYIFFLKEATIKSRQYGAIKLTTLAEGELFLNNRYYERIQAGDNVLSELHPGEYTLEVRYDSGSKEIRKATVKEGQTVILNFTGKPQIPKGTFYAAVGFSVGVPIPLEKAAETLNMTVEPGIFYDFVFVFAGGKISIGMGGYFDYYPLKELENGYVMNIPAVLKVDYFLSIGDFYLFLGAKGGIIASSYKADAITEAETGILPYLSPEAGIGFDVTDWMSIYVGSAYDVIFFADGDMHTNINPFLRIVFNF